MSTPTPDIHPTVRIHRRLAATYGHVDQRDEPFWIEPGAGAGTYVLGGALDMESASELARLVPPPGATEITLDLSGITCIDSGYPGDFGVRCARSRARRGSLASVQRSASDPR